MHRAASGADSACIWCTSRLTRATRSMLSIRCSFFYSKLPMVNLMMIHAVLLASSALAGARAPPSADMIMMDRITALELIVAQQGALIEEVSSRCAPSSTTKIAGKERKEPHAHAPDDQSSRPSRRPPHHHRHIQVKPHVHPLNDPIIPDHFDSRTAWYVVLVWCAMCV